MWRGVACIMCVWLSYEYDCFMSVYDLCLSFCFLRMIVYMMPVYVLMCVMSVCDLWSLCVGLVFDVAYGLCTISVCVLCAMCV